MYIVWIVKDMSNQDTAGFQTTTFRYVVWYFTTRPRYLHVAWYVELLSSNILFDFKLSVYTRTKWITLYESSYNSNRQRWVG